MEKKTMTYNQHISPSQGYSRYYDTEHWYTWAEKDPSGLWQGSRALAGPVFLSMHRVFILYSQLIRFARFEGKSVNRGLLVLDKARALDPCHRPERSWGLRMRMRSCKSVLPKNTKQWFQPGLETRLLDPECHTLTIRTSHLPLLWVWYEK